MMKDIVVSFFVTIAAFLAIILPAAFLLLIFYLFGEDLGSIIVVFLFVWVFFFILRVNYK